MKSDPSKITRSFYYGCGKDKTIHAYSREEWGIGGSLPYGNYSTHTLAGVIAATCFMAPTAVVSVFLFGIAVSRMNLLFALVSLFFSLVFGMGAFIGLRTIRQEFRAKRLRKISRLPKPWSSVTDQQAMEWFKKNPSEKIALTRESFPDAEWD